MKFLKQILIFTLCVLLISVSIGSRWFDVNNMTEVEAVDAASLELSAEVMALICAYVGSVYLAYANNQEMPTLTENQIAEFGHNILKSAVYSPTIYLDSLPGWSDETDEKKQAVMAYLDSTGQSYVLGSEALQETAEESWTVIQGGLDNHNDDDGDEEEENNIIKFTGEIGKCAFALPAVVTTAFGFGIKQLYNDIHSDNTEIDLSDLFSPLEGVGFHSWSDLEDSDGMYICKVFITVVNSNGTFHYIHNQEDSCRKCVILPSDADGYFCLMQSGSRVSMHPFCVETGYYYSWGQLFNTEDQQMSVITNLPIFASDEARAAAYKSGDYSEALNYNKPFDIADWLQDDWSGSLVDPLTGLSALSDWFNRARHTGLNSMGHDISYDDMIEYLRDYFTNAGLGKDIIYDPLKDPIVYPSDVAAPVIDPNTNPSISPVVDPPADTDPAPGTSSEKDPSEEPETNTEYDPEEITDDIDEMNKSFGGLSDILKYKFPFCVPWDILTIVKLFASEPETPYFEIPMKFDISSIGITIDYALVLDFKDYEILSDISRFVLSIIYCIGLIRITFNIAEMKKE